jgi:hypothetical protein
MKAAEHNRAVRFGDVEDAIGEPPHERPSNAAVHFGIGIGVFCKHVDDGLEGPQEVIPEIGAPRTIPSVGVG